MADEWRPVTVPFTPKLVDGVDINPVTGAPPPPDRPMTGSEYESTEELARRILAQARGLGGGIEQPPAAPIIEVPEGDFDWSSGRFRTDGKASSLGDQYKRFYGGVKDRVVGPSSPASPPQAEGARGLAVPSPGRPPAPGGRSAPAGGGGGGRGGIGVPKILPTTTQLPDGSMLPQDLDEARNVVETMRLQGKLTDKQAKAYMGKLEADWETVEGLGVRQQHEAIRGRDEQAEYEARRMTAESDAAQAQADMMRRGIDEQREMIAAQQRADAAYQREMQSAVEAYQQAAQEVADIKIDPDRWMSKNGAFGSIATVLSAMFAQAGTALTGAPNMAMSIIDQRINADLQAQETMLKNKQTALAAQESVLGRMRQLYGDDAAAKSAAREALWQATEAEIERQAREWGTTDALAKRDAMLAAIESQKRVDRLGIEQAAKIRAQEKRAAMLRAAAAAQRARSSDGRIWRKGKKDDQQTYVETKYGQGFAPDAKTAQEVRAAAEAAEQYDKILAELQAINEKPDESVSPQERARAQALYSEAFLVKKEMANLGVIAGPDMDLVEGGIGKDPSELWQYDPAVSAKLQTARQLAQSQIKGKVRSSNIIPAERRVTEDGPEYTYTVPNAAPTGQVSFTPGARPGGGG